MNRWRPHILSDGCSYISADTYAWGDSVRWWTSLLKINHSSVSVQYKNNHFALMRPKRALTTSCGEAVYSEITESICVRVVTKTNCKVNRLQECISIILHFAFQYLFYNHTLHLLCLLYYKVQVLFLCTFPQLNTRQKHNGMCALDVNLRLLAAVRQGLAVNLVNVFWRNRCSFMDWVDTWAGEGGLSSWLTLPVCPATQSSCCLHCNPVI